MPDYDPNRGGEGPTRRPAARGPPRRYGPGGLPTEGIDPAPKPHPLIPWLALLLVVGFLALQLYPATHFRHPKDPSKAWVKIHYDEYGINHQKTTENAHRTWFGGLEQQQEDFGDGTGQVADSVEDEVLKPDVQVVLATDEVDLRPLAVVINSTISNSRHPERIKFHLVIPPSANELEYYKLKTFFPKASIEILSEGIDLAKISKLITYREESKARKELTSPYNFILYHLPQLLKDKDIHRIIYLDTDVVVKGDLEQLYSKGLEGFPVAAVPDCSQRFETYFDFKQLEEIRTRENGSKAWLPLKPFNDQECVFNRGTLVIDVNQWIEQNVTEAIEWWMNEYKNSKEKTPLYQYGESQPPFLLALYRNYKRLELEWNVRGLGRSKFSDKEREYFAQVNGERPEKQPFRSMESDTAKIVHFNGEFKPWKRGRERLPDEQVISLCGGEAKECYKMWWEYLDQNADLALRGNPQ